jgi:hypothetical protein
MKYWSSQFEVGCEWGRDMECEEGKSIYVWFESIGVRGKR